MALIGIRQHAASCLGGAIALALLILPVIIITTREAVRAVPREIRQGSLALGATQWQTTWRQTLPSAVPGHRHRHDPGAVAGDRRGGTADRAGPGRLRPVRPNGLFSDVTALPMQIYSLTSQSQEDFQTAASAAIIVLLVMILGLNGLAIFIRNKFQRNW